MRFCKTILYCLIVLGVWAGTVSADLSFTAYSFSSLFKSADSVVYGEVTEVSADETNFHITFAIKETLMGSLAGTVTVTSPLYRGACLDDQAYLDTGFECMLFLKKGDRSYTIINGVAGVLRTEYFGDVRVVAAAYNAHKELFTSMNNAEIEQVIDRLSTTDGKRRFLESLNGQYTAENEPLLKKLLTTDNHFLQGHAAVQAGYAKIEGLRCDIEALSDETKNVSLREECLFSLAQYADPRSVTVVLSHLNDPAEPVRRTAVLAAGIIGTDDFIAPLVELYSHESDFAQRLDIVTALGRLKDTDKSTATLVSLKTAESNGIVLAHLDDVLTRIAAGSRR